MRKRARHCKEIVKACDFKKHYRTIVCQELNNLDSSPSTGLTIIPTVKRYFYSATERFNMINGLTLPATLFYNDDGSPTTEFMNYTPNGYANLNINGLIQQGGMYTVTNNALIIEPSNSTILQTSPIIIELLSFVVE